MYNHYSVLLNSLRIRVEFCEFAFYLIFSHQTYKNGLWIPNIYLFTLSRFGKKAGRFCEKKIWLWSTQLNIMKEACLEFWNCDIYEEKTFELTIWILSSENGQNCLRIKMNKLRVSTDWSVKCVPEIYKSRNSSFASVKNLWLAILLFFRAFDFI